MHVLNLSFTLAKIDFKLRNEGNYLGILWYVLNPFILFTILFFIFSKNLGTSIPQYPLYLLLGLITFNYFRTATVDATRVFYDNRHVIRSIHFPLMSLVLSLVLRSLYAHVIEIIIFTVFLYLLGSTGGILTFILYSFFLMLFFLFIFGISLLLATLSIYFFDLEHIWGAFTQALWFATPLFYEIGTNVTAAAINALNPLYYFIHIFRELLVYNRLPEISFVVGTIGFTSIILIVALLFFKKAERYIPERF